MGQAKIRGTLEKRQAEGVAKRIERERKQHEAFVEKRAAWAEKEARKTPEERDRDRRAAMLLTSLLGMAISSSSSRGIELERMIAEYANK